MPKGKKKRITKEEAEKVYPNEWVVCCDPRDDGETGAYIDGVVYWHGKDQKEAYKKSAEIKGDTAVFYTGSIPYRTITFHEKDEITKAAA